MNSTFFSLSIAELQQAFADTHPIVFNAQHQYSGQTLRFTEYVMYYMDQYPQKLLQPIQSFHTKVDSHMNMPHVVPSSMVFHKHPENEVCTYLTPSINSMVHLEMLDSDRSFVVINYTDPEVIGTNNTASKYASTLVRFQTREDLETILKDMYRLLDEKEEESRRTNFRVYSIDGNSWTTQTIKDSQCLDQVFIKASAKASILDRIKIFETEQERAKRFGKPYKLGLLFYGVPGSGKTSLVKAIAKQLKKRLYIFSFSKETTDDKMSTLLRNVCRNSVVVFEDVDSFFVHRESNGCNVSFSSLINQLDGITNSDAGLIMILTANHVDKLDPALLRAGRMDLIVKFDYPEKEEIKMAFDAYLDHLSQDERDDLFKKWYPLVKNKKIPMSAFTDFLYRDYRQILEKTPEFLKEHEHLMSITTNANSEKMYL